MELCPKCDSPRIEKNIDNDDHCTACGYIAYKEPLFRKTVGKPLIPKRTIRLAP